MQLLGRLVINAAALWVATEIVPGISFTGDWWLLFVVALVFGVLNVAVRPILLILTLAYVNLATGDESVNRLAVSLPSQPRA